MVPSSMSSSSLATATSRFNSPSSLPGLKLNRLALGIVDADLEFVFSRWNVRDSELAVCLELDRLAACLAFCGVLFLEINILVVRLVGGISREVCGWSQRCGFGFGRQQMEAAM